MDFRGFLRSLFKPWVILGAVIMAAILFCGSIFLLWITRSTPVEHDLPTAALTVVSVTTVAPSPTVTSTSDQGLSENTPLPTPPSNEISLGSFVRVTGTGGEGLRLRARPGLTSEVRLLGQEAEVFQVRDGPSEVDGYIWWYLVSPEDESRSGWAVSNYLEWVQNP